MNKPIQQIRAYPKERSIKIDLFISIGVVILGAVLGLIAKATDSVSIIGDIGTELGIWVFVATLIAAFSRYPLTAAINTLLFFLAMLASYYLYGNFVLGFFPQSYFLGWLAVALISPIAGFIVWFARGKGTFGIIASAIPASILFASGYPAFYTHSIVSALSLIFGIILIAILPKTIQQKALTFVVAIVLAFIISQLNILSLLPF